MQSLYMSYASCGGGGDHHQARALPGHMSRSTLAGSVRHLCPMRVKKRGSKKVILSLIFSFINYISCSQPDLTSTPRCSPHECAYSEERSLFFQVKNILTANIGAFIT